jgi:hypothetical protein
MGRMAQMDFEAAIVDFSRAIDLDHSYAVAFYCRGMAQDSLGKEQESQDDLRRAWVLGSATLQGELDKYGIIRTDMDKPRRGRGSCGWSTGSISSSAAAPPLSSPSRRPTAGRDRLNAKRRPNTWYAQGGIAV